MTQRGIRWRVILVVALVAGGWSTPVTGLGVGAPGALVQEPETTPTGVVPASGRWMVTLLTGEVVDVTSDASGRATIQMREQSDAFSTVRTPDGDVYVIPETAMGLVGRILDLELFDVTALVRQGYDDASSSVIPLIIERPPGVDVQSTLHSSDERPLPSIGGVAVEVAKADAAATGRWIASLSSASGSSASSLAGITRVWLDSRVTAVAAALPVPALPVPSERPAAPSVEIDGNLTQIGADDAWAAGLTGEGVTVAVLDTGIDPRHPDLAGQIVAQENFSSSEDTVDRFGHGTHVASLVVGTGAAAGGARSGVAPDAQLVIGKVLDDSGFGFDSDLIAGMEWAAPQADVVNLSLGAESTGDGSDPVSMSLDRLSQDYGTLFVVAAGNSGPGSATVTPPGVADRALTVGAVDADDDITEFSSRGPVEGSYELKPEVVAPGVDIVAARAAGTALGDPIDENYTRLSGTSMATPEVAGAAAVLAGEHPDWSAEQLKSTIIASSAPIGADGYDAGAGRIDVGAEITATLLVDRDVVEASLARPRTVIRTETLTWTNTGEQPATVTLEADLEDRQGQPVDGVSITPAQLTIGPGGTGSATLQIDGPDLADGLYSGVVTAAETGANDVRTPIAVHAVPEQVDLTIAATPIEGAGTALPVVLATIANLDDFGEFHLITSFEGDTFTVPVPAGRYAVTGGVGTSDFDDQALALVGDPDVSVTADTTVAFDAAGAAPLQPAVEGLQTAPPIFNSARIVTTPRAGTGGEGIELEASTSYPVPPVYLTPMQGEAEQFAANQTFRVQTPFLAARVGDDPIEISLIGGLAPHPGPSEGQHTLTAVDTGDGSDLSRARGQLALVTLPAEGADRAAITHLAAEAGVALLAFVDEQRSRLTLNSIFSFDPWADVPVIAAGGTSASRLRTAATAGERVTVTSTASPVVYDIVGSETNRLVPDPVVDRAAQSRLATIAERFHRDADGPAPVHDERLPLSVPDSDILSVARLMSWGPLPQRRTAHVTPGVAWLSTVAGSKLVESPFGGDPLPASSLLSMAAPETYSSGGRYTITWLRRPQWPGPVGGPSAPFCQPRPVARTADTLHVALAPFQDGLDRFGCENSARARLTLERDGLLVGTAETHDADFSVPRRRSTYRLTYAQEGQAPYPHRSTTSWTFRSSAPTDGDGETRIPLLVVGYDLPLDTLNRPTGDVATFHVRQVTGAEASPIRRLRVWTSTDGTTWRSAAVRERSSGRYEVTLPDVARGTGVSLRVDATDAAGGRIEQTLDNAYIG
jgi:subtilisin family serine protease